MLLLWSSLLACIGGVILGVLVLLKAKRSLANTFFSLMSICLSLVAGANYFSLTSKDSEDATLFWIRAVMFLVPFLMFFLYYFALSYLNDKFVLNKKKLFFLSFITILLAIINCTSLTYLSVKISDTGVIIPQTGFGLLLNGFYILPIFGLSIVSMVKNAKISEITNRKKINFALYFFLISFGIQIFTSFIIVALFNFTTLVPVGNFLIFLFIVMITISIFQLKFFEMNLIGSMSFVIILSILIFAEIFTAQGYQAIIYKILVFLSVSFVGYQFIKNIKIEAEQKKEIELLADKLKKANDDLKELDQTKSNFLSMASHELNTPLSAIEGYLSMIIEEGIGGKLNKVHKEYLTKVFTSSKRLAHLVHDLLNVSRIEQNRIHLIYDKGNIDKIIKQAISEVKPNIDEQHHKLIYTPNKNIPETWSDVDRVTEIVINLLGNAVKYTNPGGKIEINSEVKEDKILVSVKDNGIGISEEAQDKIWGKFDQGNMTRDQRKGTGLGLYIVKNLVELHKGEVWVESQGEGKGSTFYFTLPIFSEKPRDEHEGEGPILKLK